jgi:hypothetical protein
MYALRSNGAARSVAPASPYKPSLLEHERRYSSPCHLGLIERHLRETGISPTRLGRIIANDPRLVLDMRAGRAIGERTAEKVDAYFRGYIRGLVAQIKQGEVRHGDGHTL